MSETSKIGWTRSTYNPHRGCRKVSPECSNCYIVDTPPLRSIGQKHGDMRVRASEKVLNSPYEWNWKQRRDLDDWKACLAPGASVPVKPQWRVFCMSLGDWLDDENVPIEWTWRLLKTVKECEALTWLMLTKRTQNFVPRLTAALKWDENNNRDDPSVHPWILDWMTGAAVPDNVWFGASMMDGLIPPALFDIPAKIHWLSAEPLLRKVDVNYVGRIKELDWIVIGGESGADNGPRRRRDCGVDAITGFASECQRLKIPVYIKQDCHRQPGQQGRIPDEVWKLKQHPSA